MILPKIEYGAPSFSPANSQLPDFFGNFYLLEGAESFWEANRFSTSQEIPCILWKPTVHYRIYKSPPRVPILSQFNPVHAPISHFLNIHLNIIPLYVRVFQMFSALFLAQII